MVDQIKNNLSNLGSSGSSKVSSESKKSSSAQIKGINHSQAKQKFDSSEVSKFVTKEKIKDCAIYNEAILSFFSPIELPIIAFVAAPIPTPTAIIVK